MASSRRDFVTLAAGAGLFLANRRTAFGAADFWNKKEKSEWSSDEIHVLTTRSPWAKDVRVEFRRGLRPNFDGTPGGLAMPDDNSRETPGSQSGVRVGIPLGPNGSADSSAGPGGNMNERRGGNQEIPMEATAATVRWESAQPLLDALNGAVPADFNGRYVISVTGISAALKERGILPDQLKTEVSLQAKGKSPAQPGVVRYSKDGSVVLFGFAKEFLPLTVADKDVQFVIDTGDIEVRAKFVPKEMIYHGQLAL